MTPSDDPKLASPAEDSGSRGPAHRQLLSDSAAGSLALNGGDWALAEEHLTSAIRSDPDDPDLYEQVKRPMLGQGRGLNRESSTQGLAAS